MGWISKFNKLSKIKIAMDIGNIVFGLMQNGLTKIPDMFHHFVKPRLSKEQRDAIIKINDRLCRNEWVSSLEISFTFEPIVKKLRYSQAIVLLQYEDVIRAADEFERAKIHLTQNIKSRGFVLSDPLKFKKRNKWLTIGLFLIGSAWILSVVLSGFFNLSATGWYPALIFFGGLIPYLICNHPLIGYAAANRLLNQKKYALAQIGLCPSIRLIAQPRLPDCQHCHEQIK